MWMSLESVIQSKVTSGREKQIWYINAYVWNLEKWYKSYLQVMNRDTHIEKGFVDMIGEGEDGAGIERVALTYIHYHV